MKSYWIVAAALLVNAWPVSSQAYVAGIGQMSADQKPVQPASSPNPAATAQTPGQTPAAATAQNKGSYLLVELSKTLKATKLKPGDKVKAEVSQDVLSHGKLIIPAETEVVGHVTEVNVRDAGNSESRLGIVFDRILLKHYHDVNFHAVVQTVRPPVIRRSRLDEGSQMLPPSMFVDNRGSGPVPTTNGRAASPSSARGTASATPTGGMGESNSGTSMQVPLSVKQSPSTHAGTGSSAVNIGGSTGATPMSVGMPQGVFGLKGLSLTAGATASTPGPVIISNTENVKLESGTQIMLHVLSVETPQQATK
jgi:hypothetical protein